MSRKIFWSSGWTSRCGCDRCGPHVTLTRADAGCAQGGIALLPKRGELLADFRDLGRKVSTALHKALRTQTYNHFVGWVWGFNDRGMS